ncbi:uncharacterized protein PV06_00413 [Exophiala oligosperma]|uniref:Uncharacterized protein n=1 Tax=Exophiala oligosperma TaxID=215243 RepID=A0A0D2DXB8_9EURO|nr:uncharacterized protein PV06_00413 [Exophiala oligosperma]KIW47748.1 hypothetical protein PV06_00413 [Exophiala oligosperma]
MTESSLCQNESNHTIDYAGPALLLPYTQQVPGLVLRTLIPFQQERTSRRPRKIFRADHGTFAPIPTGPLLLEKEKPVCHLYIWLDPWRASKGSLQPELLPEHH